MNEFQRDILSDIIENTEAPEKIKISLHEATRDVTIVITDCDDQEFQELWQNAREDERKHLVVNVGDNPIRTEA